MPKLTVTAVDGFSAMDEIVGKLGEDAVILSTRKVGSKVEITATNESKTPLPPRRARKKAVPETFEDVFIDADLSLKPLDLDKTTADVLAESERAQAKREQAIRDHQDVDMILNQTSDQISDDANSYEKNTDAENTEAENAFEDTVVDMRDTDIRSAPHKTIIDLYPEDSLRGAGNGQNRYAPRASTYHMETAEAAQTIQSQIAGLQKNIQELSQQISGMVMTEGNALSDHMHTQLPYRLKKAGFSDAVRQRLAPAVTASDFESAKLQFTQAMADTISCHDADFIQACDIFVIIGASGSGKTSLSAKLAAHMRDQMETIGVTLASYEADKINFSGANRNHARLLNLPFMNLSESTLERAMGERDGKLIIDCNADAETAGQLISRLRTTFGTERVGVIIAVSGNSSARAIERSIAPYTGYGAILALTHLDECEFGAFEFSALMESDAKIGLLTATPSFIDALVVASPTPIQQYLLSQI